MSYRTEVLCVVLLATVVPAFAQTAGQAIEEQPLIYAVNRAPTRPFETARSVKVITRYDIWRKNARTLPELLMEEGGVWVQQTDYAAGSPIIRGLMGKEILILIDGVKLNNATYRYGPLQYLATIDIDMVERVEIVRGVGSALTSYALGGVINIITKNGPPAGDETRFGGNVTTRLSSADNGITGHASAYGRSEKVRYFAGLSYRTFDDLEAGSDVGTQEYTGYSEKAANLSFDYYLTPQRWFSLDYQRLEQNEVPRTDRLESGANLEFEYDPQILDFGRLAFQDLTPTGIYDEVFATLSWGRHVEDVQRIEASKPSVERQYEDTDTATGLTIELGKQIGASHRLLYGVDVFHDTIDSARYDVTLATGNVAPKRGNFTDGATYDILAAYLHDRIEVSPKLTVSVGLRYSQYSFAGSEDTTVGTLDLDGSGDDLTGSLAAVARVAEGVNLVASVARGVRSPNIDDVSVYDERPEGIEVPNPDVKSVYLMTYEAGVKLDLPAVSGSLTYYHSDLTDAIERASGSFLGLPCFDKNDNGACDPGEPPILQKANIGESRITGTELDFRVPLSETVALLGNHVWTEGENLTADEPMSRIPPAYGALIVRWQRSGDLVPWAELVYQFAGAQRDICAADAADTRIGPDGTDGFSVFHVRGGLTLGRHFRFTAALENILDETYKYHASSFYRPGRQLVLGAELKL